MEHYIAPTLKLHQHLDRIADLRAGKRPPPVSVEIDLSNACSKKCGFCHFAYTHTRGPWARARTVETGDFMDTALAVRILDELRDYGVRSVTFSGGGEPTLHPDFDEIVANCAVDDTGLYTHGGHIDARRAQLLKTAMRWVYVSLDECTREKFKAYAGVDMFDRVLDGVRHLVAAECFEDWHPPATVGLGFLLNERNHRDVWAMLALGRELGVDYVQFRPTVLYNAADPGKPAEDTTWMRELMPALRELEHEPGVQVDVDRFEMYRTWQGHGYATCWWASLSTVITPDARVWICCNVRGYEDHCLGDLKEKSFAEIWESAPLPWGVTDKCRVMCRGHLVNRQMQELMQRAPEGHENFI